MHPHRILAPLFAIALATPAIAADSVQRKAGLWQINSWLNGSLTPGPTLVCVGPNGDDLVQDSMQLQPGCAPVEVRRHDHTIKAHAVCTQKGLTTTSDATIIGDLASRYHGDMEVRYDPPRNGIATMHLTQEARWTGPCPSDLKAGQTRHQAVPADAMLEAMKHQHEPR